MLYKLHSQPKTLKHHEKLETHHPEVVWLKYRDNPTKLRQFEHLWAKDAYRAVLYAAHTLRGPFPAGERIISTDPECSCNYALLALKGPFPKGEKAISEHYDWSFEYAWRVLKGPFPMGEEAISKDPYYSSRYAREVLKAPFPLGENAISKNSPSRYSYLKAFPERRRFLK